MDARESLAKGSCRDGDLWDHLCPDQRPTTEDSSFEPASCCFAWSGLDGFDRRDDSGAGLSRGQLRYAGPVTRDDDHLGISLSGALFRLGGGRCFKVLTYAATNVAFF